MQAVASVATEVVVAATLVVTIGGCAGVTVISIYRFVLELIVDRNELCSRLLTEPSVAVGGGQPPFSENVVGLYGHQNSGC